jgi:AraC family transcriptional regulator
MPKKGKAPKLIQETLILRNMSCSCCIRLVETVLKQCKVHPVRVVLGKAAYDRDPQTVDRETVEQHLTDAGFEVVHDKEEQLVAEIRQAVIELVHHTTFNAMVRNSDFLVGKFNRSYSYLSSLFSKHTGTTLEKYIILLKIEKVKELIEYDELTLSEIAYMMGYSSVQYLSTQFKNSTGISVTEYKNQDEITRIPLDQLG